MADDQLVLWGEKNFHSPYVLSCWVVLKEKGIPFELRTFDLAGGEHRRGDYAARSVTGRVPSLQHGARWLAESSAIDEYLEEVFPSAAVPAPVPGAALRARPRAAAPGLGAQ